MIPLARLLPLALLLIGSAHAADVRVTNTGGPRAIFQPTAGGYLLKQPGFTPNLSSVPQELNPSSGVKGRGAFGGGAHFRIDGTAGMKSYDMGATYDMPVPGTKRTVPVTAVSKGIPARNIAKAVFKALPVISTAVQLHDLMNELASDWDSNDPAGVASQGSAIYDPEKKVVQRQKDQVQWTMDGTKFFGSPSAACGDMFTWTDISINRTYVAIADELGPNVYGCRYPSPLGSPGSYMGGPYSQITPSVTPIPQSAIDSFSESLSPSASQKVDEIFEDIKSKPGFTLDVPTDLPTVVSGPSSVPQTTTTTRNPDGSSTTTTTTTTITYEGDKINITSITSTTNISSTGDVTEGPTTETSGVPDPVPSDTPEPADPSDPDDPATPPADPDMPEVPDFYEQKYPDGFQGVWDQRIQSIKAAPLFSVLDQLTPPDTGAGGSCPVWMLDLNLGPWSFGSMNASPPCEVWTFLRVFVMLGALILARALIFGG